MRNLRQILVATRKSHFFVEQASPLARFAAHRTITDKATYEKPHQYSVGMKHVFLNGVQVLKDGEHTGAKPGKALWGPGKTEK
jgi:hypothetical protein